MSTGEWLLIVGTGMQLASIAVLWQLLHQFLLKVTTKR